MHDYRTKKNVANTVGEMPRFIRISVAILSVAVEFDARIVPLEHYLMFVRSLLSSRHKIGSVVKFVNWAESLRLSQRSINHLTEGEELNI